MAHLYSRRNEVLVQSLLCKLSVTRNSPTFRSKFLAYHYAFHYFSYLKKCADARRNKPHDPISLLTRVNFSSSTVK